MLSQDEPTGAEWAEMVRTDQNLIVGGLSPESIDTDDFLYVQWRIAAEREGEQYSEALRRSKTAAIQEPRDEERRRNSARKQLLTRTDKALKDILGDIDMGIGGVRLRPDQNMVDAITSGLLDRGLNIFPSEFEVASDLNLVGWYAEWLEMHGDLPIDETP